MALTMNYETSEFAKQAIQRWAGAANSLQHINDSGNSVYQFQQGERRLILRLTDPAYRTSDWLEAELEYLRYLDTQQVKVGVPVVSISGARIEAIEIGEMTWLASAFTFAEGEVVNSDSVYWREVFFREWGRTLARIHQASSSYQPTTLARRWHWHEEDLVVNARRYLPPDDSIVLGEFDFLMHTFEGLPQTVATYGMTHADMGLQNFHYDPKVGITTFDFGNCCYHWYVSDIAIAFSTLRAAAPQDRAKYQDWILAGYREIFSIDETVWDHLDLFWRWRVLYVYLDRLERFRNPSLPEHQRVLRFLKDRVQEQATNR